MRLTITVMYQLVVVIVSILAGVGQATPEDIGNVTLFISRNISTVEGDIYAVNIETDMAEGREIVHSTMNGNDSQTVITDHRLNIRVVVPVSESEDCHFLELDDEENQAPSIEEDTEGVTMESAVSENVNATDERACLYKEDDLAMTEELKTALTSVCGPRKIRHLTRKDECLNVPQDEDQGKYKRNAKDLLRKKKCVFSKTRKRPDLTYLFAERDFGDGAAIDAIGSLV
ncbi:uncharacterized protein LOC132560084 [Ylistrum balloti]|uniref:uncharacterized protein LOC132560084 n=1 Tax=Ylistrum balloti TaxID=509963 RepID=UPI002905ACCB|nr:uncharacterized protein LOC132560084 [Ylistrum balloti]